MFTSVLFFCKYNVKCDFKINLYIMKVINESWFVVKYFKVIV